MRARAALLGAACGLAALLRWANVLLALVVLVEALPRFTRPAEWRKLLAEAGAFVGAALLVFSPQLVVWKLLYGSAFTIPQGGAFVAGAPAWSGVLFSPRHGLFSWSPLLYLGLAGLWLWHRREPWRAGAAIVFGLALVRVNAGVADWWGGAAFGGRRFDALLPFLGLGMAFALDALAALARRRPMLPEAALLTLGVLWNVLLARQYRSGVWDFAGPVAFEEMGGGVVSQVDRALGSPFALPGALFERWTSGVPLRDYEPLFMQRRFARWSVRMGLDERMFLEDGWSEPRQLDGVPVRLVTAGAGFVVGLHEGKSATLGARLSTARPEALQRVRLVVNERPLGAAEVGYGFADHSFAIPESVLRPGRNVFRLRLAGDEVSRTPLAVAALWLDPAS